MKIHNFTPHVVTVFDDDNNQLAEYQPCGLARAQQLEIVVGEIGIKPEFVPLKRMVFGGVEGLPETAERDEYFIVSSIAAQAARAMNHPFADKLLVPSDPVRDGLGQVVGCRSFSVF